MRVDRHVFGSRKGYTTLAQSEGVTAAERRLLESFTFGQTTDARYLTSLPSSPAYISRPLGAKRRAVTRVLQGQPDDQGRATLLFVSAILSNTDWTRTLRGDVWPLMNQAELWQWNGQEALSRLNVAIPGPARLAVSAEEAKALLGIVSELERLYARGTCLVLEGARYAPTVVRAVEMLLPDETKGSFSSAARSLSANMDVRLNCIARGANVSGPGPGSAVYRPAAGAALSPYAAALFAGGLVQGVVPWNVIQSHRGFGAVAEAAEAFEVKEGRAPGAAPAPAAAKKKVSPKAKLVAAFAAFALVACAVLGFGLVSKSLARRSRDELIRKADSLEGISSADFALRSKEDQESVLDEAQKTMDALGDAGGSARAHADALKQWMARQKDLRSEIAKKRSALENVAAGLRSFSFPRDDAAQLSPETARRLQESVQAARKIESAMTVKIGRETVDLSGMFAERLHAVAARADRVAGELASRERAYRAFKEKVVRTIRGGDAAKAGEVKKEWTEHWRGRVREDPQKTETLTRLHKDLQTLHDRPKRKQAARAALQAVIAELGSVKPDPKLKDKKAQEKFTGLSNKCRKAAAAAETFGELRPYVEEAQRALARARETLLPPKKSEQDAAAEKEARKYSLLGEIAKGLKELEKLRPTNAPAWQAKVKQIKAGVAGFQKLHKQLGAVLGKLIDLRVATIGRLPPPKPRRLTQDIPYVVAWKSLEPAVKYVRGVRADLVELKDLIQKTKVPEGPGKQQAQRRKRQMVAHLTNGIKALGEHLKGLQALQREWDEIVRKHGTGL